ncbi:hypothetical protein ACQ5SO_10145 [Rhodovulum sp. DZ06]|uniref:hypothetical protein n=1 Tax=Rhodovulum sp. DZ06 TaxID=3425126 RepID=UPI003D34D948
MSDATSDARAAAAAARLFALLPAQIRADDAAAGRALEALFQALGAGSAELDAALDAFHDALFVETAQGDALEALAALVAAEPMAPLPEGAGWSPRAFIANTIRHRRGKGTARALQALAADVTGEGAAAVEYFQRLVRLQHLSDVRPERPGLADLRDGEAAQLVGTAHDRTARLADLRSIARAGGRAHVPMVGVHLLRPLVPVHPAPDLAGEDPGAVPAALLAALPQCRDWAAGGAGAFQLAAQPGEAVRLFNPARGGAPGFQASPQGAQQTPPQTLPDRLRRLPLCKELDALRRAVATGAQADLASPPWFDGAGAPFTLFLRRVGEETFRKVPPEELLIANLADPPPGRPLPERIPDRLPPGTDPARAARPIAAAIDPETARIVTAAPTGGAAEVEEIRLSHAYGIGRPIGAGAHERNAPDVPFELTDSAERRHFIRVVDPLSPADPGASGALRRVPTLQEALDDWGAHGAGMFGVIVLTRSDRAAPGAEVVIPTHPGAELHLVAAEWRPRRDVPGVEGNPGRRGYLVRRARRFTLDAPVRIEAAAAPGAEQRPGAAVLDGLELTQGLALSPEALSGLRLRHCTLRNPGGPALLALAPLGGVEVALEDCLCGPLSLDGGAGGARDAGLRVLRSVISADGAGGQAIAAESWTAEICDATVLGDAALRMLRATNVIFDGALGVARRQDGCLRYSYAAPGGAHPRRYRCQPDLALAAAEAEAGAPLGAPARAAILRRMRPVFLDRALSEPTAALLHPLADPGLRTGGEGGTEMGAFAAHGAAVRRANLTALFDDYLPFGAEAAILDDGRSTPAAMRRNRP